MQSRKQVLTWCTHIFITMSNVYQVWEDTGTFQCMIRSEVFLCGSCDARIQLGLSRGVESCCLECGCGFRGVYLPCQVRVVADDYDIRCLAVQSRQHDLKHVLFLHNAFLCVSCLQTGTHFPLQGKKQRIISQNRIALSLLRALVHTHTHTHTHTHVSNTETDEQ